MPKPSSKPSASSVVEKPEKDESTRKKEITEKIISGREKSKRLEIEKEIQEKEKRLKRKREASSSSSEPEKENNEQEEEKDEEIKNNNKSSHSHRRHAFTTGTMIGHAMFALIFISFPLSEPGIDWQGVFYVSLVNVLYNFIVRASSLQHLLLIALINIVTLQWYRKVPHLYLALLSMGPVRLSVTFGVNILALVCGYYLYVRRTSTTKTTLSGAVVAASASRMRRRQGKAWDKLVSTLLVANVLVLVFGGTIGLNEAKLIVKGFASLVVNMPTPSPSSSSGGGSGGPNDVKTEFHGRGTDPNAGIPSDIPNGQTFKHKTKDGMEFEFF
jgi:hypothetical protein